jgi:hypothetical protein
MALDLFKNFAKVTVSTGYDASATSIVLSGGHGAKLPTPPFNVTYWNATDYADPSDDPNVEIVRVTAIASNTLTVTRGQEGITASTKNTASKTYKMIAGLTAKTFNTDLMGTLLQAANGRLTLESGVPVSTADQTAKTTIYFTPYNGNCISLYDGSAWVCHSFNEISLALGTLTADKNYDVFLYDNAGTLTLELGAAWTSDILRNEAITLQNGIYVKSGATTRRYLGTFRTTSTTTTEDSLVKRFAWNYYNRIARSLYRTDTTTHAYTVPDARLWNNNSANAIAFVQGVAESAFAATCAGSMTGLGGVTGVGLDGLAVYRNAYTFAVDGTGVAPLSGASVALVDPLLGYHILNILESAGAGSVNFNSVNISASIPG